MGKGSSAPSTSTVEQSNLPAYAEPYFTELLERTSEQSTTPYTPYEGPRIAEYAPETTASYDLTRQIAGQGIAGLPEAMGATYGALQGTQGLAYANQPYEFSAGQSQQYGYSPTQTFTGQSVGQYMSPYMQNVLDVQKEQARRQFEEQGAGRNAQAVQAGAFGGSRQAVQEGMAERDLLNRMADIQATGQQNAFQSAQQAFQSDRAADFARQQAQAAEQARAQGIDIGELGRVQGAQAAENRAAGQFGLGAFGQAASLGGQLAALGETGRATDIQNAQLLETVGTQQQGLRQQQLDLAYQDFLRQQAYPEQQLQLYSSILRGVPVDPTTSTTLYQPYNPLQQALGAGLGAIGLYRGMSA